MPTYHLCGVVGHIKPNCSLLRHEPKLKTNYASRNTDVPKFAHVCHFCCVFGHIRPKNCSLLRHEPKLETNSASRNTDVPKFAPICHFCGVCGHIHPNYHKLKFMHSKLV